MLRRILIVGLALSLSASPVLGQSLHDSIQRPAAALAAQASQVQQGSGIPPAFLWPAVGLLVGGGVLFALGTRGCGTHRYGGRCETPKMVQGAVVLGVGAGVLLMGRKAGKASPQLITTPGGIVLRSRFTF